MVGDRQAVVEMKKTTSRVGSGRGRFLSGRGGFRNDGFRGRGNFGGGRNYGRNEYDNRGEFRNRGEFENRGEFSGRGRGPVGRSEDYQQGRGRINRPSRSNQTAVAA